MIKKQYVAFKHQSIVGFVVYCVTIIVIISFVNFYDGWLYKSHIILENFEFHTMSCVLLIMGFISIILSLSPNFMEDYLTVKKERYVILQFSLDLRENPTFGQSC